MVRNIRLTLLSLALGTAFTLPADAQDKSGAGGQIDYQPPFRFTGKIVKVTVEQK